MGPQPRQELRLKAVLDDGSGLEEGKVSMGLSGEGILAGVVLSLEDANGPSVEGVAVIAVDAGSRAEIAGFQAGDIITAINLKDVGSPEQVLEMVTRATTALLSVMRDGQVSFIVVRA